MRPTNLTKNLEKIEVRNARAEDSEDILSWRNDELTIAMSSSSQRVDRTQHEFWFLEALKDNNCKIFIGTNSENQKIGVCRFNINTTNFATVSINLNPNFRNRKLSSILLRTSIDNFLKKRPIVLRASVKKENTASSKCFEYCGFHLEFEDEKYNHYIKDISNMDSIADKLKLIDEIEKIRAANNVNWMDLLRLAFINAPEETKQLIRKINTDDNKISTLFAKLGE